MCLTGPTYAITAKAITEASVYPCDTQEKRRGPRLASAYSGPKVAEHSIAKMGRYPADTNIHMDSQIV